MGWTAAAIIGSAVIGGIASSKAASAQKSAAAQAGAISEAQYQQNREDQAPYRNLGEYGAKELGALYGFPGQTIDESENQVGSGNRLFDRIKNRFGNGLAGPVINQDGSPTEIPVWGTGEEPQPGGPRANLRNDQSFNPVTGAQEFYSNGLAQYGRGGDTEMAHVTPGEMVVPESVAQQPGVRNRLAQGFRNEGMNPSRYVVGGRNSLNPYSGRREFYEGFGGEQDPNDIGGNADVDARQSGNFGGGYNGNPRDAYDGGGGNNFLKRLVGNRSNFMTNPSESTNAVSPLPDDYYTQDAAKGRFYDSPDYTINFDEGAKALEQSAAARGGLFSGNTGTALVRYGQDYGNRLYNQYANRLASFAGLGQNAAAQTGNVGAQVAGQQGNALMYGGNAAAQGWYGLANSVNAGIGNALYYNQAR